MTFHPRSKQMILRCKIYLINPSLSSPPATLSTITCNKIFAVVTYLLHGKMTAVHSFWFFKTRSSKVSRFIRKFFLGLLGHWLDMVYLPPRGNFVDHIFLEAQCLARILQHVSPLTMAALSCNSLLHFRPRICPANSRFMCVSNALYVR